MSQFTPLGVSQCTPRPCVELKLRFPSHHLEQCQSKHYKVEVHILNYIYSYYNVKVQDILTVR